VTPDTPDTSDVDQDPRILKVATKSLAASLVNTRKRPAEDAQEGEDSGSAGRVASKRRVIQRAVFVEIPIKNAILNSKARIPSLLRPATY